MVEKPGLHDVVALGDARCVHQDHRDSLETNRFFQRVARGPWNRGDDGSRGAQQAIHQARFADVGSANDGCSDAVTIDQTLVGPGNELFQGL